MASRSAKQAPDVVDVALADALRGVTAAGEWTLVTQLARELEARTARQAPTSAGNG